MGQKLSHEQIDKCCADRKLDVDVGSVLNLLVGALLGGESKILTDTAEVNNPKNLDLNRGDP